MKEITYHLISWFKHGAVCFCGLLLLSICQPARAEGKTFDGSKSNAKRSPFEVFNVFDSKFSVAMPTTELVNLDDEVEPSPKSVEESKPSEQEALNNLVGNSVFVSSNPLSHLSSPEEDPKVRINPEAPGPFIGMALANQRGDTQLATRYASQYVRYLVNLMYEVSDLTRYVGDALVNEKLAEEEDIIGLGQVFDYEFARARTENRSVVRPTHEQAMRRVKADPQGQIYIYYLFSVNCRFCAEMSPDVERLWQITKKDPRVKMAGLVLGQPPKEWIKHYREYTGLSLPIVDGSYLAHRFHIGMLPALIVVSPNNKISYLKTGKLEFLRMYELVMSVQGLPTEPTPEVLRLANKTVVGQRESLLKKGSVVLPEQVKGKLAGKATKEEPMVLEKL